VVGYLRVFYHAGFFCDGRFNWKAPRRYDVTQHTGENVILQAAADGARTKGKPEVKMLKTTTATGSRAVPAPHLDRDRIAGDHPGVDRADEAKERSTRMKYFDPNTCERDNNAAELEFIQAMQAYKMSSGRMFPTWSEVLEVLCDLGYEKPTGPQSS
jgi:hypothetical protein